MFNFKKIVSKGVKEFCEEMVKSPDDWVQGQYEFINKNRADLSIWTCNGTSFITINGDKTYNILEKRLIVKAIKQTKANQLKSLNK